MKQKRDKTAPGRPKDSQKRDSIVRAATTLFMKDGYTLTSMEAVAKKADVSKLTIYSHFANKVELFREVIRQRCDKLALIEAFMAAPDAPPEPTLLQIGEHFLTLIFNPDSLRLHRVIQAEVTHHPEIAKVFYESGPKRVRAAFTALLDQWCRKKQLTIADTSTATEQFFSLLKGEKLMRTLMMIAPAPTAKETAAHVRAAVDMFLAAYRPKGAK